MVTLVGPQRQDDRDLFQDVLPALGRRPLDVRVFVTQAQALGEYADGAVDGVAQFLALLVDLVQLLAQLGICLLYTSDAADE